MAAYPFENMDHCGNALIDSLRSTERRLVLNRLTHWRGTHGQIIHEPGDPVEYAFFPLGSSMASFRVIFDDGRDIETALIGNEGAVGGIVSRGHLPAYARAIVQFPGLFAKIALKELEDLKLQEARIASLFNRYADCLVAQIFQATACNAAHTIEQRAAKWLLAAAARTGSDQLTLTQEQLAGLLGVGRSYVSRVIGRLKTDGVVQTGRSRLVIRDHQALEGMSCRCDGAVRHHFEQLLKGVYPAD